jgi:hypothetical protein
VGAILNKLNDRVDMWIVYVLLGWFVVTVVLEVLTAGDGGCGPFCICD